MAVWTDAQLKKAQSILSRYPLGRFHEAVREVERATGRGEVTPHALRSVFLRANLGPPSSYCKAGERPAPSVAEAPTRKNVLPSRFEELLRLTRKGPTSFSNLCNKLDLSPAKAKALVAEAKAHGVNVHVEHDHVGIRSSNSVEKVREVGIAPVVGERQKVAVISDTHLGSKYCLRKQMREFIHYAYEQGVREILHPGDVLEGMYRHATFEVSHVGLEDQAEDLYQTLPHLPGLNYRCITGNHDFTFSEHAGLSVGGYLKNYFRERGRKDLHFYGDRSAFLRVKGAKVHLWHPKKGMGYAKSYAVQKQVEKYSSGEKPNLLLIGHWHVYCHVYERGVHGIACPTFQGGGSAFSKSLGGAPAIGGLILSWDLTEHGTMRAFNLEYRSYFELERTHSIEGEEREELLVTA